MPPSQPSLLLIVPAHNEEERIAAVLRGYAGHFQRHFRGVFRLLVVLNDCTDNTLAEVQSLEAEFPAIGHIDFPGRIGRGGALIEGLKRGADMEWIGYVNADGATSPAAFCTLLEHLEEADCVIGSRWLPESVLHVPQSSQRRFYSRGFHALVELLFRMGIKDTQCGAKVMRRAAVEKIHASLTIADLTFDINLLYSLKRAGYRVLEVPTEWADKLGTRVSLSRAALAWFLSVVRLRLVYSPFYRWLAPVRPVEVWLYRRLGAPPPLSVSRAHGVSSRVQPPVGGPPNR
jgi:glycosyltransferase involved in cell wall biosynthesis